MTPPKAGASDYLGVTLALAAAADAAFDALLQAVSALRLADDELRAEMVALRDQVAALQRRQPRSRGARDRADQQLLDTIAQSAQGLPFRTADLLDRAALDPALAAAFEGADLVGATEVGCWLSRMKDQPTAGLTVRRGRLVRGVVRWWIDRD